MTIESSKVRKDCQALFLLVKNSPGISAEALAELAVRVAGIDDRSAVPRRWDLVCGGYIYTVGEEKRYWATCAGKRIDVDDLDIDSEDQIRLKLRGRGERVIKHRRGGIST